MLPDERFSSGRVAFRVTSLRRSCVGSSDHDHTIKVGQGGHLSPRVELGSSAFALASKTWR